MIFRLFIVLACMSLGALFAKGEMESAAADNTDQSVLLAQEGIEAVANSSDVQQDTIDWGTSDDASQQTEGAAAVEPASQASDMAPMTETESTDYMVQGAAEPVEKAINEAPDASADETN